ncbi:uncharacterized protein DUF2845 [Sinobacterium caligoides]|uniref:Uncharacterized protein DUF2845 n=2 Tax=Sinobacterium caligoides TaxID=933926 RepID=A0A3N2DDS4_9GAMM|nr:uncharacterized protein DUF2845 [Sinobacterium caligoides]
MIINRDTQRPIVLLLMLLMSCSVLGLDSSSLRCGSRLVGEGDLAIQLLERCGEPLSRELIGYTLRKTQLPPYTEEREFKIEQWIYPPEAGFYHEVILEAGKIKEINRYRQ